MAFDTTPPRNDYIGTGGTFQYDFTFRIFEASDLQVTKRDSAGTEYELVLGADFTVTGVNDVEGGTITLLEGSLPSGWALTIRFNRTPKQTTDLRNQGGVFLEVLEDKFDEVTRYAQQHEDALARSLHYPDTEVGGIGSVLPTVDMRKGKYVYFDATTGEVTAVVVVIPGSVVISAYMEGLLDDVNAGAARVTLGFSTLFTKGDFWAATAPGVIGTTAIGTVTGETLIVNPAAATGLAYAPRSQPNPVINGNMDVWQRGSGGGVATNGSYVADRWRCNFVTSAVLIMSQSTNVPTFAAAGVLFNYSLQVGVSTADAAIAAGDYAYITQRIEGVNWRHFAQRQIMLSFWVKSSKVGIHSFGMRNTGTDRFFVIEYSILAANTWELKKLPIFGSPAAGTWDYLNGIGVELIWTLAAGSNSVGDPTGSWEVGSGFASLNQVNVLDSNTNFFSLTGVKLELGSVATPMQFRSFNEELDLCQRYYEKSFEYFTAPIVNVGTNVGAFIMGSPVGASTLFGAGPLSFKTRKRGTPTFTLYNPSAANNQIRNDSNSLDCTGSGTIGVGETGAGLQATTPAGTVAGHRLYVHWAADAEL